MDNKLTQDRKELHVLQIHPNASNSNGMLQENKGLWKKKKSRTDKTNIYFPLRCDGYFTD